MHFFAQHSNHSYRFILLLGIKVIAIFMDPYWEVRTPDEDTAAQRWAPGDLPPSASMTSRSGYCPGVPGGCPRGYCAADTAQVGCVILNRINPHRLFERSFGVCDFNIAHSNFSVIRFILQPCSFNNYEGNFVQHFRVTSTASALVS